MMIELLSAGLVGDLFSFEAEKNDNNDGGPARGGEFIMAFSPQLIAGEGWSNHSEKFFTRIRIIASYEMWNYKVISQFSGAQSNCERVKLLWTKVWGIFVFDF